MSSLLGYIFGSKKPHPNSSSSDNKVGKNELVHTFLEDVDFVLVDELEEEKKLGNSSLESSIQRVPSASVLEFQQIPASSAIEIPQPNEELIDFETIEMSVANLLEFVPTLSSSPTDVDRNSIRQQILEDENMKERFRLFLQEQHQESIRSLSSSPERDSNSKSEVSSDSEEFESTSISIDEEINNEDNNDNVIRIERPRQTLSSASSIRSPYSIPSTSIKRVKKNQSKSIRQTTHYNNNRKNIMRNQSSNSFRSQRESKTKKSKGKY